MSISFTFKTYGYFRIDFKWKFHFYEEKNQYPIMQTPWNSFFDELESWIILLQNKKLTKLSSHQMKGLKGFWVADVLNKLLVWSVWVSIQNYTLNVWYNNTKEQKVITLVFFFCIYFLHFYLLNRFVVFFKWHWDLSVSFILWHKKATTMHFLLS